MPSPPSRTQFTWLAILLMIPRVSALLAAGSVPRGPVATTAAAREAARAYATAGSDAEGERRAEQAVALAMHDQGIEWAPSGRVVACGDCTYAAGSSFTVDLTTTVRLPFVPRWLCPHRCAAGIRISAHHRERLDCYA